MVVDGKQNSIEKDSLIILLDIIKLTDMSFKKRIRMLGIVPLVVIHVHEKAQTLVGCGMEVVYKFRRSCVHKRDAM